MNPSSSLRRSWGFSRLNQFEDVPSIDPAMVITTRRISKLPTTPRPSQSLSAQAGG